MKKIYILFIISLFMTPSVFCSQTIDDYLFSIAIDQAEKFENTFVQDIFQNKEFVMSVSESFAKAVGILERGFIFDEILEREDYYLVKYKEEVIPSIKIDDNRTIYNNYDWTTFVILFDKKEGRIVRAFYI